MPNKNINNLNALTFRIFNISVCFKYVTMERYYAYFQLNYQYFFSWWPPVVYKTQQKLHNVSQLKLDIFMWKK